MNYATTLFSLMATLVFSFGSHAVIRENGGFQVPSAAVLNFISIGAGIDKEIKSQVDALIQLRQEAGQVDQYLSQNLGMEGEARICVRLKDYDASVELNTQLDDLVRSSSLTQIKFTASCH